MARSSGPKGRKFDRQAHVPAPDAGSSGMAGFPARAPFGLARLRRTTSSGRVIAEIDGLRFVAIATVVLYHLNGFLASKGSGYSSDPSRSWSARLLEHGHVGVQLFFVISGFILALPFASHYLKGTDRVSKRTYFARRLTRLEPPYIVTMLFFFVMLGAAVGRDWGELTRHLVASLFYVHNAIYGTNSLINSVAWSLEVEIQFYLLVPFLARLFAIRAPGARRGAIVALGLAAIAFQALFISPETPRLRLSILDQLQFFLVGFLMADIYLTDWRSTPEPAGGWDLATLMGWPLIPILFSVAPAVVPWVLPGLLLVLYCAAFRGTWSRRLFRNVWLTTIGGMCYTIYLLHYPFIWLMARQTMRLRLTDNFDGEYLWQVALILPALLLVCTAFYLLIERPCMRPDWPRRLMAFFRPEREPSPAADYPPVVAAVRE